MSFATLHILTKFTQGGLPDTAITLITISQPVGGHNPDAVRKLGEIFHEEKTSIVFFLVVVVLFTVSTVNELLNAALPDDFFQIRQI
jgi:hypothetical protein